MGAFWVIVVLFVVLVAGAVFYALIRMAINDSVAGRIQEELSEMNRSHQLQLKEHDRQFEQLNELLREQNALLAEIKDKSL
ncbi:hypothetical protein [Paenibacillus gorillae]|uniref:hypothetical protein n=1 Tax=Paenibacillus gorillae TaxID=1243662 RepID=UPI0004B0207C|nr:hypothetical protein [Paenibacillus gorillae]